MPVKLRPIEAFGEFDTPLRNIRAEIDGCAMVLRLYPSITQIEPLSADDVPESLANIMRGARPLVERGDHLELSFDPVHAMHVSEEFVGATPVLDMSGMDYPKIPGQPGAWPLLEVENSPWRAQLPDYQGGDDPNVKHYHIVSMETYWDILGVLDVGCWNKAEVADG